MSATESNASKADGHIGNITIPTLIGHQDYRTWSMILTLVFKTKKGWDETSLCPKDSDQNLLTILGSLSPELVGEMVGLDKASTAWQYLKNKFAGVTVVDKVMALKSFINCDLGNGQNLPEGMSKYKGIAQRLASMFDTMNLSELAVWLFLVKLPEEYEVERLFIEQSLESGMMTLDDVISRINKSYATKEFDQAKRITAQRPSQSASVTPCTVHKWWNIDECWNCHPELKSTYQKKKKKKKNDKANRVAEEAGNKPNDQYSTWNPDTGATISITPHLHLLKDTRPFRSVLRDASGNIMKTTNVGSFSFKNGVIENVVHATESDENLLSIPSICKSLNQDLHRCALFTPKDVVIADFSTKGITSFLESGVKYLEGKRQGNTYGIRMKHNENEHKSCKISTTMDSEIAVTIEDYNQIMYWHRALNHINFTTLQKMAQKQLIPGLSVPPIPAGLQCEECIQGKSKRHSFKMSSQPRTFSRKGELVSVDIAGPEPMSRSGYKYLTTFLDHKTGYKWILLSSSRAEVYPYVETINQTILNKTGRPINILRSDGEFFNNNTIKKICKQYGIHQEVTEPDTSEQNGKSERGIGISFDRLRTLLIDAQLPEKFWCEAARFENYVGNICPSPISSDSTPYLMWHGRHPSIDRVHQFGERCYLHVAVRKRKNKIQPRAIPVTFVGYSDNRKAYRVFDPAQNKVIESISVHFLSPVTLRFSKIEEEKTKEQPPSRTKEFVMIDNTTETPEIPDIAGCNNEGSESEEASQKDTMETVSHEECELEETNKDENETTLAGVPSSLRIDMNPTTFTPSNVGRTRSGKVKKVKHKYSSLRLNHLEDPKTYDEAMSRSDKTLWQEAIGKELKSFTDMKVWDESNPIRLPKGANAVDLKWVFKIKRDKNRQIIKYRARLCARGFTQVYGQDYYETFAPVASHNSLRAVLSVAAANDWEIDQGDVNTAFLIPKIDEDVYVTVPKGLGIPTEGFVFKLHKAVYGLKQAGRCWYADLDGHLRGLGFVPTSSDPCVYTLTRDGTVKCIILIYVDDILFCGSRKTVDYYKKCMADKYPFTDMGEAGFILGYEINRNRKERSLTLNQYHLIADLLEENGMENCRPETVPAYATVKLTADMAPKTKDEIEMMKSVPYRSVCGTLNHISVCSRPDISEAVGNVCRFVSNPGPQHWPAVKRIMRYLKGTATQGITLGGQTCNLSLVGYCDADWAGDPDSRRSKTGYIFMLGDYPIAWKSALQKSTALSSMESEVMAISAANQEAIWLRSLLKDLGLRELGATVINEDNQSCIAYLYGNKKSSATKHMGTRYNFIKENIQNGDISVKWIPSVDNPADLLTKSLSRQKFDTHVSFMHMNPYAHLPNESCS